MRVVPLYYRPSPWGVISLILFVVNFIFFVISFCSTAWASVTLDGRHVILGLWQGCVLQTDNSYVCNGEVLENASIRSDRGWHQGTQVLMTCSLVLLVCTEILMITYVCVEKFQDKRETLASVLFAATITQIPITAIILLMFGSEVKQLPDGNLMWGYGFIALCLILTLMDVFVLYFQRYVKRRKNFRQNGDQKVVKVDYKLPFGVVNQGFQDSPTDILGSTNTLEKQSIPTLRPSMHRKMSQSIDLSELSRNTGVTYLTNDSCGLQASTQSLNLNVREYSHPERRNSLLNSCDQIIINTISSSDSLNRVHVSAAVSFPPGRRTISSSQQYQSASSIESAV